MLVVGDKEVAASTVSVRLRSGEQAASQSVDSFKKTVTMAIADKIKDLRL
jgi:threonyl-tRNA synthetase